MSLLAVCSTVWSYATLQLESPELRRLLDAVAKAMTERAGDCNPQELSNTVSHICLSLTHSHLCWTAEACQVNTGNAPINLPCGLLGLDTPLPSARRLWAAKELP